MKVVLLTSNSLRHKYIAAQLATKLELKLIVTETKSSKIQDTTTLDETDAEFVSAHFRARDRSEASFIGQYENFPAEVPVFHVPHGCINGKLVKAVIDQSVPDILVLFGTSIIKEPLLKKYSGHIVNLHLGLSPYYKGSATNLFPYFYNEPECVGATIHLASAKVDEGAILHQIRPDIEPEDDLHSIGNKTILKAGKTLPGVIEAFSEKKIIPQKQTETGRICRNKDVTPNVLRKIYSNFEDGMIKKYLGEKDERDAGKPILGGLGSKL